MNDTAEYMVIVAHPDDAEFGCGGSVANWCREGKKVVYVVCTNGNKGSSDPDTDTQELAHRREKEQLDAANLLGVSRVEFLRHPDQGLEDTAEFRKELVVLMRTYRPRVVITMDPYRKYIWHRDHRITGQVALDAVFPFVRDPLAYPDLVSQGILPHKVEEIWFFGSEDINHREDISDLLDVKMESLFCHVSQMESMGQQKVEKWVKKRCREMAEGTTFSYAEGYHRVEIPV